MVAAVISFACVPLLGPGDTLGFALICLVSGATIGADLTLLPALFARHMARIAPRGGQGFGLWAFAQKLTLAFAAAALLPLLELSGFRAGPDLQNPDGALRLLTYLYAILPCGLKLLAIAMLLKMPLKLEED
jgi:GPH family glycoside/pentoside/hexuronide:cation symporter